jgi:hypothetical protein
MARPTRINAGDDISWTESAGTATAVTYYFQNSNGDSVFSVAATIADGVATFSLTGSLTVGQIPATYSAWKAATTSAGRWSTFEGDLVLAPNVDGSSAKTHAQTVVPLLEAHLAGRVVAGLESHTIDGQTINKIPLSEARALLNRYRSELKAEQSAFNGNAGKNGIISHRFSE